MRTRQIALMLNRAPFRLVLFDFDGTLADTFPLFLRLLDDVSRQFALRPLPAAELEALRGMSTSRILSEVGVSRRRLPAILRHARQRMTEERDSILLFPGVPALLESLADSGSALAVVSSNSEETARTVLGSALSARVDAFACGVGLFGKARKVRGVLRQLGVAGKQAVFVGDEERDINAARRAGVTSLAVTWGYASEAAITTADLVCRTLPELANALGVPRSPRTTASG